MALILLGVSCHRASSDAEGSFLGLEHDIAAGLPHSPQHRLMADSTYNQSQLLTPKVTLKDCGPTFRVTTL